MKSKHATEDFPWTANEGEEDLTCIIDDYTLRVEQMDKGLWWWCVYYKDEQLYQNRNTANSKYRAIGLAEGQYMGHSIKQKL
jgi:hypothetical protein